MVRGERPIKLGNSWFFVKFIEVDCLLVVFGGRVLEGLGGFKVLLNFIEF